jgi:hypothetical protein
MAVVFEVEDSDFAGGSGLMEVCSSNEMGAPNASHLGTGDHAAEPTEADQDQSGNRACVYRLNFTCLICRASSGGRRNTGVKVTRRSLEA